MSTPERENEEHLEMPLSEHLEELRRRIIFSLLAIAAGAVVAYIFSDYILNFVLKPYRDIFPDKPVIFIKPTEAFLTYLKLSFISGFFAASPFVIYQIWAFVAPGLYRHEKIYTIAVVVPAAVLFLTGAAFAFFVVLPYGLRFLLVTFAGETLTPMISVREYLSFIMHLCIAFGIAFLSPVVLILLGSLGIISSSDISAFRPYAVVGIFALAAILTPPDVFTQVALAFPLIFLFEIGFAGVWIIEKLRSSRGDS